MTSSFRLPRLLMLAVAPLAAFMVYGLWLWRRWWLRFRRRLVVNLFIVPKQLCGGRSCCKQYTQQRFPV